MKVARCAIDVYDVEIDGMSVESFAHYIIRLATFILKRDDLIFEGFDESMSNHYSDVEFFEVVKRFERHLMRRVHGVQQFVLLSPSLDEALTVIYSNEKLTVIPLYGQDTMFSTIQSLAGEWGTYEINERPIE